MEHVITAPCDGYVSRYNHRHIDSDTDIVTDTFIDIYIYIYIYIWHDLYFIFINKILSYHSFVILSIISYCIHSLFIYFVYDSINVHTVWCLYSAKRACLLMMEPCWLKWWVRRRTRRSNKRVTYICAYLLSAHAMNQKHGQHHSGSLLTTQPAKYRNRK